MELQRRAGENSCDETRDASSAIPGKETQVQRVAAQGVSGAGGELPFADAIAASFGPAHAGTVRGIQAHTGGAATAASEDIGARAYATGNDVAFGGTPDLHTAAHEAAHVVQQRQGVHLKGGVGESGDSYERHADAVADRVVHGLSAASLLGEPGAGGAPAVQRDDWGPEGPNPNRKRDTADKFEPVVGTDPLDEEREVLLGQTVKQEYHVSNAAHAPAGTTYTWEQSVVGRKTTAPELTSIAGHHGTSATASFKARAYGDRTIKTAVTGATSKGPKRGEADDVKMSVPLPKVADVGLDSTSKRWGTRPVIDQMVLGDDLQVTVKYDHLATKAGEADLDLEGDQFIKKGPAKQTAPGVLVAVVTPKAAGRATGRLMLHALDHDSVDPAKLDVDVRQPSDEHDAGPQPSASNEATLPANAIEQALDAWDMLTEQRRTAVHQVMLESQKVDPPPPAPWWHALLKAGVEIALAAATGGIAAGVAAIAEEKFLEHLVEKKLIDGIGKEGIKEFAKTFVEESLNKVVEKSGITGEGGEKGGGDEKGLPALFLGVEMTALGATAGQEKNFHRNHLRHQVDALEAKSPNAGVRYAMALEHALLAKHATSEVMEKQYVASFQAYNNLLARLDLHTTAKDESNVAEDAKAGTNLESLVVGGADNLKTKHHIVTRIQSDGAGKGPVGVDETSGGDGPRKVAGVLRLELAVSHGRASIKKATLPGITSQSFANTVGEVPLRELGMNVIGIVDEGDKGAVVGRSDVGVYSAHAQSSDVLERLARGSEIDPHDPAAIAKLVLDHQLGDEHVKPKLG